MLFLSALADACIPAPANSYRPWLLGKPAVAFFLAVVLVAEGSFVLSLFNANPSQMLLSAVAQAPSEQGGGQWVKTFARAASEPARSTGWALGAVAVALAVLMILSLVFHSHIQPVHLLAPAGVVLGIALVLLALNAWYAGAYGIT